MMTELERRLSEAFHEDARRARLANPDHPAEPDSWPLADAHSRAIGRGWIVAAAAATVLVVAGGVALIQHARNGAPAPIAPTPSPTIASTPTTAPPTTAAPPRTTSPSPTQLFADIAPDSTVPLAPAPISRRVVPAAVWTGTEIIMWGGVDARSNASVDDGAAFNLASGTWRVIAPAPIQGRSHAAVAWTGTEMIVWGGINRDGTITGGFYNQTELADGAAYNPRTDAWRRLPDAPLGAANPLAVWTGEEVVILGASPLTDPDNTDAEITEAAAAAFDPTRNEWRPLVDVPSGGRPVQAVWTGTTILATLAGRDPDETGEPPSVLVHYDLSTDTWHIDEQAGYVALVGVPDADGVSRTVLALPLETGAPIAVLDSEGNSIGSLPAIPVDRDKFGDTIDAQGDWVGGKALFWVRGADWFADSQGSPQAWAVNPTTETWRRLPGADVIEHSDGPSMAAGDVLLATWTNDIDENAVTDGSGGIAYRVPTTPTS